MKNVVKNETKGNLGIILIILVLVGMFTFYLEGVKQNAERESVQVSYEAK